MDKNCRIEVTFDDGHIGVKMQGTTMDLVAGYVTIVRAMYESLGDSNGGKLAQIMFRSFVENGMPFDDENFTEDERERCESEDELDEKLKAAKAKKQLADIVELLVKADGKEDENNGEV